MSRRTNVARLLDRVGALELGLALRARTGLPQRGLTVLLYHRVIDLAGIGDMDPDLVDATPASFDAQMALVKRHLRPVSLDDVLAAAAPGGPTLPPNAALVTFDDGYRDNLEIAVPILRRHGIRATFFVATGYMSDERRLFWWEQVSLMVRRARVPRLTLTYPRPFTTLLDELGRRRATRHLARAIKDVYDLDLERLLAELGAATGHPWTPEDDAKYADAVMLRWDGVRALRDAGMDVASHTKSHRVLQTLTPEALARELGESKAALERELGARVRALAYPVGKRVHALPAVRDAVRDAGYDLGFVVHPGVNDLAATGAAGPRPDAHYDLKRIPVDRDWDPAQFRGALVHHAFAG